MNVKRTISCLCIVLLLFAANYIAFTGIRSLLSTIQGYEEMRPLERSGTYIANLDPESEPDLASITNADMQKTFDYIQSSFDCAVYSDGYITELPDCDMEVALDYMSEEYCALLPFELAQGSIPCFNNDLDKDIPVVVGAGLSKAYPLGSEISVTDPALGHPVTYRVTGVLKQNACRSNFYSLNWKSYLNFSVLVPINEEFIENAGIDFHVNALMDLIVLNTTEEKTQKLGDTVADTLGFKLNFYTQSENNAEFKDNYLPALLLRFGLALVLFAAAAFIALRTNGLTGIHWAVLCAVCLAATAVLTAVDRHSAWIEKSTLVAAYGFLGLIGIDWLALAAVMIIDALLGAIIIVCKRKKLPLD